MPTISELIVKGEQSQKGDELFGTTTTDSLDAISGPGVAPAPQLNQVERPQAPTVNGLANAISQGFDKDGLTTSMDVGGRIDPALAGRIAEAAAASGLPENLVRRNIDQIEAELAKPDFNADEFLRSSPIVAQWVQENPINASLVQDQVKDFTALETILGHIGGVSNGVIGGIRKSAESGIRSFFNQKNVGNVVKGGQRLQAYSVIDAARAAGEPVPANPFELMEWLEGNGVKFGMLDQESPIEVANYAAGNLDLKERDQELVSAGAQNIAHNETMQAELRVQNEGMRQYEEAQTFLGTAAAIVGNPLDVAAPLTVQSFAQFAPSLAAFALGRGPGTVSIGVGAFNAEEAGDLVASMQDAGIDPTNPESIIDGLSDSQRLAEWVNHAERRGVAIGAVNAISAGVAGRLAATATTARQAAGFGAIEMAGQAQFGVLEEVAASLATGDAFDPKAAATEAFVGLPVDAVEVVSGTLDARARAKQKALDIEADLTELANPELAAKIRQGSPTKLREIVNRIAGQQQADSMYVDAEKFNEYYQSQGVDPVEQARALLGDKFESYQEALEAGGQIVIPVADYVTSQVSQEDKAWLAHNAAMQPNQMSPADWEAYSATIEPEAVQEGEQADTSQEVYDDVFGQLLSSQPRDIADANAKQMAAVFRTLADRTGMSAAELYNQYNLQIKREVPESLRPLAEIDELDVLLDQLRAGEVPTEVEALGPSLVDFIRERGIVDEGGELAALDIDEQLAPFQRRAIQEEGLTIAGMAETAAEAGYIAERDPNVLIDTIGKELRGERVFAAQNLNEDLAQRRQAFADLEDYLNSIDVDISQLDNAQIKAMIDQATADVEVTDGVELDQEAQQDAAEAVELYQSKANETGEQNLFVFHNITQEGLLAADRLGGLAAPSLGVGNVDVGALESFGEITLLADPSLLTSGKIRTFDADIYSPRQPRAEAQLASGKLNEFLEEIDKGDLSGLGLTLPSSLEDAGVRGITDSTAAMHYYLDSIGKLPKFKKEKKSKQVTGIANRYDRAELNNLLYNPDAYVIKQAQSYVDGLIAEQEAKRAKLIGRNEGDQARIDKVNEVIDKAVTGLTEVYLEDGKPNNLATSELVQEAINYKANPYNRIDMRKQLRDAVAKPSVSSGFNEWAQQNFDEINQGLRLFKGYTSSGSRKYVPYTLDNVVAEMRSKPIKGGEESFSAGSVRAAAQELKGIKEIQAQRGRIISNEEMQGVIDQSKERVNQAIEEMKPFADPDIAESWDYFTAAAEAITTGASAVKEIFQDSPEAMAIYADLMAYLQGLPTEYFEAKAQRAVDFSEFNTAIVPKGTAKSVIELLRSKGLKVKRYDAEAGNKADIIKKEQKLLFQGKADKRGSIKFGDDRQFTIQLFEKADLSTFLHESGHFYLEVLGDLAERPGAPQQIKDDYATLLNWFGVESRDQIQVDQHEQFARGFEAYLFEGKAPSEELRSIFSKFWAWMRTVYQSIRQLDVELTDEVREVFDRLVATDAEIEVAKSAMGQAPLFATAEDAGMSDEEFAKYQADAQKAVDDARTEVIAKVNADRNRAREKWYREEKAKLEKQIRKELSEQQVYVALSVLQSGKLPDGSPLPEGIEPMKLSKADLVAMFGKEFLKRLPRPFVYQKEGGMNPDHVADIFGFNSGREMIMQVAAARNPNQQAEALAEQQMLDKYGDMFADGEIPVAAMDELHSEAHADIMMLELTKLAAKTKKVPAKSMVKARAEDIVASKLVKDIKPIAYQRAEAKASRKAFEAMERGDRDTAYTEKQKQLLNHELYRAARDAKQRSENIANYMRKFDKKSTRERIGKAGADYLDQIDSIMERFEFRAVSLRKLEKRAALADWVRQKEENGETLGEELAIPEKLLNEAYKTNYKQLEYLELTGLYDAVRQIEQFARLKNRMLADRAKAEREQVKAELLAAIEANVDKLPDPPISKNALTAFEKMGNTLKQFDASLIKMEQIIDWLDNGQIDGIWHRAFWDGATDAQTAEQDYTLKVTKRITEAVMNIPADVRKRMTELVPTGLPRRMTRKDLIGVALNTGTQSNYNKMLKGMGWNEGQVEAWLSHLTKEEWDFVQGVWDTLESMWPDIASLQKELTGLEPDKLDARQVKTRFGTMRGGYYPVMYDPLESAQGEMQLSANVGGLQESGSVRATTPKGHTKARIEEFSRPFNLDIDDLPRHIAGVVKDLTHRKWVIDANWIINDPEIKQALRRHLGDAYVGLFRGWVQQVVNDRNFNSLSSLNIWRRMIEHARSNFMIASMGFKATTLISQISGIGPSIEVIGGKDLDGRKYFTKGLIKAVKNPRTSYEYVTELSGEMRHRLQNKDRDIRDTMRRLRGESGLLPEIQRAAMAGIGYADLMVTLPTWLGAYEKGVDQGMSQDVAVRFADKAVRMSQGSGGAKDLASVAAKSGELMRLFTMFYTPFSAMYSRLRSIGHDFGNIRDVPQAAIRAFWVWLVPATLGELLVARGPEEDEDWGEWLLEVNMIYLTLGVPILRDVVSGSLSDFGYSLSPLAQTGKATSGLFTTAGKVATGDKELSDLAEKAFKASGYLVGLPTGQMDITGSYLLDLYTGADEPDDLGDFVRDLLFRRND